MATYISVDVEADGPVPGLYSMVCFGAVIVEPELKRTFYGQTAPISEDWLPDALKVSGFSREQHKEFDDPLQVMKNFDEWINANSSAQPILISDNNGFDAMFIAYYFHKYLKRNPFGWSSRRIGDLYCGLVKDSRAPWKHKLRKTKHTHHPVDDAKGNAEAVLSLKEMGIKFNFQ